MLKAQTVRHALLSQPAGRVARRLPSSDRVGPLEVPNLRWRSAMMVLCLCENSYYQQYDDDADDAADYNCSSAFSYRIRQAHGELLSINLSVCTSTTCQSTTSTQKRFSCEKQLKLSGPLQLSLLLKRNYSSVRSSLKLLVSSNIVPKLLPPLIKILT